MVVADYDLVGIMQQADFKDNAYVCHCPGKSAATDEFVADHLAGIVEIKYAKYFVIEVLQQWHEDMSGVSAGTDGGALQPFTHLAAASQFHGCAYGNAAGFTYTFYFL